ncbi:MAG: hypothetical protein GF403_02960 [Candidatus Coatesbacteria bacterium]|nr:hypothetical protein [Candidatus Coatesbacteria bacterium]
MIKQIIITSLVLSLLLCAGCAEPERHVAVDELYQEGVDAWESGDLATLEETVAAFEDRFPGEPPGLYLEALLTLEREGLDSAVPVFDAFYHQAYERYISGYDQLEAEQRRCLATTRGAAVRTANLYVEHSRYSEYEKFSFLVEDLDTLLR